MKPGQDAIYYITGEDKAALARSPHLEGFRAKGVEVLFLTDAVDEFWLQSVTQYKDHAFKSVTRGGADLANVTAEDKAEETKPPADSVADLVALAKLTLGDAVKDVRTSERLRESAVCLVADEGDMDIHLERMLKAHKRLDESAKRILEVNPGHPLIRRLADLAKANGAGGAQGDALADAAWLLLDQARILEGEPLPDPVAFGRRLAMFVEKGLA
jgi:molecular chaperone HtpG